jgi:PhnB protein
MKVNTYLNYGGNCEAAFRFYEKNLGAKIIALMRQGEMPGATNVPENLRNNVLHARIQIGDAVIMASDAPPDRFQPMRSVYLTIGVNSSEEAERIHKVLAEGGEIFMPMQETFYAHRFSMLRDKFGTSWMIIHEKPMPQA